MFSSKDSFDIKKIRKPRYSNKWAGGTLDDRRKMYHLALQICKEEGLSSKMTNDLLLTIAAESGFNQWYVYRDKSGNFYYGLCQFGNDLDKNGNPIWIGSNAVFSSVDEVLENPEKCIHVMCQEFKKGNQKYWVGYNYRYKYTSMLDLLS